MKCVIKFMHFGLALILLPFLGFSQLLMNVNVESPTNFVFDDLSDFQNGISNVMVSASHSTLVAIISTTIEVNANNADFTSITNSEQIPVNIVSVSSHTSGTDGTVNLNNTVQTLATNVPSGGSILLGVPYNYSLSYDIANTTALFNRPNGIYSVNVIYHSFGLALLGLLEGSANAVLNLDITNIIGISSNINPVFDVDSKPEYSSGIVKTENAALTITSTLDYDVTVQASGNFSNGTQSIPVGVLSVGAINAGGTPIGSQAMSQIPTQIVDEGSAALLKEINLEYSLAGGAHFFNLPNGSYTTTLTYSISAD